MGMRSLSTTTLVGAGIFLLLVAGLLMSLATNNEQRELLSVSNFDECVAAGNPIMESYPEQCRTQDGRTFVNERQSLQQPPGMIVANGCAVAGCSGQLCVSADEAAEIITTCEFRAEYACYREASCEPQTDGRCGWTETPELQRCLSNPPALEAPAEMVF